MPWTTAAPILIWAALFVPITLWFLFKVPQNKFLAFFLFLGYIAFNLFCVLTINWAYVNYYLRFIPVILSLVMLVRWAIYYHSYRTPFFPQKGSAWLAIAAAVIFLAGAAWADFRAIASMRYLSFTEKPVLALLPVRAGMYVVVNGGDAVDGLWMNNYLKDWLGRETDANPSLAYALDFVHLYNDTGRPTEKTNPKVPGDHVIYDEPVYSPCMGTVVHVEDGHPEVPALAPGWENGNFVVVQCAEFFVTLSNLRNGSFFVKEGDTVTFNRVLAHVGNSGDRTVPHLHMHATVGGWEAGSRPVPVVFDTSTYGFAARARNHLFIR